MTIIEITENEDFKKRLDVFITNYLKNAYPRAKITSYIDENNIFVNGKRQKPSYKLKIHDLVEYDENNLFDFLNPDLDLKPWEFELDIRFEEISPELMDKYSLAPDAKGVVITEILPGSDAEKKGLRAGDVVAKIDKKDVFTLADVRNFVNEAKMENNRPVLLLIQDKGIVHFAALKLKESK